ncbi:histidinol-phosphatase [Desulfogranum japonicum]|uniref:histidinol-phosphatase n=1 Tax=Desulfogranum japonicum TaxID=231447 RepID=UPI000408A1BF|nr:histidinol-phosphatase [Desulfogranum japonicum]
METQLNLTENISVFSQFAADIARKGGECAKQLFRSNCTVDVKTDKSPVTTADRNTEALLRKSIQERYPDHGILGEEYGDDNLQAKYVWSLDPIDGTRSFISGHPVWGTLVALLHEQVPVVGAVEMPALTESWNAFLGGGCYFTDRDGNRNRCTVSRCARIEDATLCTTSPLYFHESEKPVIWKLIETVGDSRFGGDCYIYCLLASGFVDLVVESELHPFDYLPLVPIIQEAGGVITDWLGQPLTAQSTGQVIAAATRELHQRTLDLLNG